MLWIFLGWSPLILCLFVLGVSPINFEFFYYSLTIEDGFVEWLTALFAISGALVSLRLLWKSHQLGLERTDKTLLLLYALGGLFFAGEEISWGQRLIGFDTHEVLPALAEVNKQDELNIHNITGFTNVRLIADFFCIVWGILVPLIYAKRPFPIKSLRLYISPHWLFPAFATCILITWPDKIAEGIYTESSVRWIKDLRLGEFKELAFGLVVFLFALHLKQVIQSRADAIQQKPIAKTLNYSNTMRE